jgi:hypothetical protein
MTTSSIDERAIALSYSFGPFKPSDRRSIVSEFHGENGSAVVAKALEIFIEGWAKADWLEDYSIERVGIWIASNLGHVFEGRVRRLAMENKTKGNETYRNAAYDALLKGLAGEAHVEVIAASDLMQA